MTKIFYFFIKLVLGGIILLGIINFYMIFSTNSLIYTENKVLEERKEVDAIVILGAGVYSDRPSYILTERLETGINLYKNGLAKKIIMSGDHGRRHYNEVQIMKDYAIAKGVPSEDIFMDHAGFSTYETMVRLKKIFLVKSVIMVSQKYHLYRAVYLGKAMDIEIYASVADKIKYKGQWYKSSREILARFKDFFIGIIKPKWYIGGDEIPLNQSGDITND